KLNICYGVLMVSSRLPVFIMRTISPQSFALDIWMSFKRLHLWKISHQTSKFQGNLVAAAQVPLNYFLSKSTATYCRKPIAM
ncbi:MAG: hypothetical protein VW729_02180, partial [Deltaproteobacteria bacterium]